MSIATRHMCQPTRSCVVLVMARGARGSER